MTLLSVYVEAYYIKISKITLIKLKFLMHLCKNGDCSYNWKKKPTQHIFRYTNSIVCWTWKKLFNDMLHFFLPADPFKDVTPLDKHCHIPVPSQWQQYCYNVEGTILHRVFLMCLVLSKIGPLPCLGEWEEREASIIIVIKLTLGNSGWF